MSPAAAFRPRSAPTRESAVEAERVDAVGLDQAGARAGGERRADVAGGRRWRGPARR